MSENNVWSIGYEACASMLNHNIGVARPVQHNCGKAWNQIEFSGYLIADLDMQTASIFGDLLGVATCPGPDTPAPAQDTAVSAVDAVERGSVCAFGYLHTQGSLRSVAS